MKAVLIIAVCLLIGFFLRLIERITERKKIKSVGCRSNRNSKGIPTIDVLDSESIMEGLEHYRYLED